MNNPFKSLLGSQKFWVAILDVFISTTLYFVTKYAAPSAAEDVKFLIAAYQPVLLLVIGSLAAQNIAAIKADGSAKEAAFYNNLPSTIIDNTGSVVASVVNPVQLKV